MKIGELHDRVIHLPFPIYDAAMKSVFPEEDEFSRYLNRKGNIYHVYLWALLRTLKPRKVLELGTGIGTGTFFMMCALPPDSKLITVEIDPTPPRHLAYWDSDPRLTKVIGNDLDLGIYGDIDLGGLDFVFVDSDHGGSHVEHQWDNYRQFFTPDAVVAFDDIHLNHGIHKFWNDLPEEKLDTGYGIHASGFGLWRSAA